MRKQFSDHNTG